MTERQIIEGSIKQNQSCQQQLFDRFAGRMMSLCLRYTNDEQFAQDILQEGFIRAFQQLHKFRFEGSFEGWLRKLFANVAVRELSKRKIVFAEVDIMQTNDHVIDPEIITRISENEIHLLIRRLPDGYRMVFNLNIIEGYNHDEIASLLGITASTSRGQLFRARKYLQELILGTLNTINV